jgi:hypothetical protein
MHIDINFYGPSWLLLHGLVLIGVPTLILGAIAPIVLLMVRRFAPKHWHITLRVIIGIWIIIVVFGLCIAFTLDIWQRQDLVPEALGGIRQCWPWQPLAQGGAGLAGICQQ